MSAITTHVLDTSTGKPASGVPVELEVRDGARGWRGLGSARTDDDGRARPWSAPAPELAAGTYRLRFDTGAWFRARGLESFWPEVVVTFEVRGSGERHHVPLLLSPFGYSTYRGS